MPVPILPYSSGGAAAPGLFPAVTVECQFTPSAWTNITAYVRIGGGGQISITRGSSRVESPAIRYDPGTMSVPLGNADRRFDPTNLAGPYVAGGKTQVVPIVPVRVSATYASLVYRLWRGFADSWTVTYAPPNDSLTLLAATDGFKILARQARVALNNYQGGGEDSGARVTRILDKAGWPGGLRNITPGNSRLQPTLLGSTPVAGTPAAIAAAGGTTQVNVASAVSTSAPLDELYLVADTELGELYMDGNGLVTFRNRHALFTDTRSSTSQAVFGDAGTELRYASVTVANDDTTLWNGATIANTGGVLQQAADASSQAIYGPRVFDSESLAADSDWQSLAYAQYVVQNAAQPELRFTDITILPQRDPANLFPQALGRLIGDRITINRRPPGGGAVISRDVFIRGITHTITSKTWETTWVLQDATSLVKPFIIGDPVTGKIGTGQLGF